MMPVRPDFIYLGEDITTGASVFLTDSQRVEHTFIAGVTGSGKSNRMLSMVRQDMEAGSGVSLIDP
jgi:late competence protein required for DNA uptake (superfamily II DNA/RNA helicase)